MNLKNAGAPSKYDRDNYSKRRITERTKETIFEYYESKLSEGKPRVQVLERLKKKYDRDVRTLERYISEVRAKHKLKENIIQARQKHWDDLADMAKEAAQQLSLSLYGGYNFLARHHTKPQPLSNEHKSPNSENKPSLAKFLSDCITNIPLPFEQGNEMGLSLRWGNLIDHLDFEFKGFKDKLQEWKSYFLWYTRCKIAGDEAGSPYNPYEIEDKLKNLTFEIIKVLNFVAERRTFVSTCDICKSW